MREFGLSSNHLTPNISETALLLEEVASAGFDYYEFELTNLSLIANHKWIPKRKQDFVNAVSQLPLKYALHLPLFLDLGVDSSEYHELIKSMVEFAEELKIKDFVLHPTRQKNYSSTNTEFRRLKKLEPLFKKAGIKVHLENLLNQQYNGMPTYNVALGDNARTLHLLNDDCYGYCFDFGHAFITTKYREEDIVEEYDKIKDIVTRIHIHDNFGKIPLEEQRMNKHEATMMGYGDLHLPPTWGEIPFEEVKEHLKDFQNPITIEIFKDYVHDLKDILVTTKNLFE